MSHRKARVSEALLSFLAAEMSRLRDPRLQLLTLTAVELSKDLKVATVYWSSVRGAANGYSESGNGSLGFLDPAEIAEIYSGLEKATGFLRKRISQELTLRYVPELRFKYDKSLPTGARIDELLGRAGY